MTMSIANGNFTGSLKDPVNRHGLWPVSSVCCSPSSVCDGVYPWMSQIEALLLALLPVWAVCFTYLRVVAKKESDIRESVIQEQMRSVESKHEELREAYMQQQQTTVELQRKVNQLTTVHETSIIINSALDRNVLLDNV